MTSENGRDGFSGRKRPLEQPEEGVAARQSSRTGFPEFERPPPALDGSGQTIGDHDPYGEDSDIFDAASLPSDTMATVLALQKEFYSSAKNSASRGTRGERTGVILQHQIYTVLENRTAVDLELTSMRKENVLRTFRLGTGREDWGIMSTEHYLKMISNLLGETRNRDLEKGSKCPTTGALGSAAGIGDGRSSNSSGSTHRVGGDIGGGGATSQICPTTDSPPARDILECLVLSNAKAYVSRKQVWNAVLEVQQNRKWGAEPALGGVGKGRVKGDGRDGGALGGGGATASESVRRNSSSQPKRPRVVAQEDGDGALDLRSLKRNEEEVLSVTSKLVRAGFLLPRRDVGREVAYWFSMPQLGKVIAGISRGRKDIVAALKRTRYKEMRRAAMEAKNPAKTTGLPLSFHIRDLLGLGMLRELDTPSGIFLRLSDTF